VRPKSENWFAVELRVRSVERSALTGLVEFHLHDSFDPDVEKVLARDGEASLLVHAYGAFTVGALLEDGTTLELDLASLSDAPKTFRER
jgi:pYEATS domain-containing protein involved in immunity